MVESVKHINLIKSKIDKLEKQFKRGIGDYAGFTLDVYYEGNREVDVSRVTIGGVANGEGTAKLFYNLVLENLKNSLKFWKGQAEKDLLELTLALKELEK